MGGDPLSAIAGPVAGNLREAREDWHPLDVSVTIRELAEWTGGDLRDCPGDPRLDRLVIDSRQAGPGALFVALAGESTDGHQFIPQAVAAGASALLCSAVAAAEGVPRVVVPDTREALVGFSRGKLAATGARVVGVTGSAGKTTTKEMIAAVLGARYRVARTAGNLNTYTGLPMNLATLEPGHEVFVAEYGMSALGEIAFLARMAPPEIAVVLNVGLAHVGLLGSVENIAAAKRELVEAVPRTGTAVLNRDDPRVAEMASACAGRVVFFGLEAGDGRPDYRATEVQAEGLRGSRFVLHTPDGSQAVELPLPGRHAVGNAVAAAAVGHLMGVSLDDVVGALAALEPVGGRMNVRPGRLGSRIIDDAYNASPGSMEASLEVLRSAGGSRVAVLGDMLELGDEAPAAHRSVGAAAGRSADLLVAVGEHAEQVVEGARLAGMPPEDAVAVAGVDEALAAIDGRLEGAVVLVKASRGVGLDRLVERLLA